MRERENERKCERVIDRERGRKGGTYRGRKRQIRERETEGEGVREWRGTDT